LAMHTTSGACRLLYSADSGQANSDCLASWH
jgi:hypothetical protein